MSTIITDFLPIEIKSKPYYIHARDKHFQYKLLDAAKLGQDVYENEYNKINNCQYALKENNHITIQEIFNNHWDEFKGICNKKHKYIRPSIIKNVENMISCRNFKRGYLFYECPNWHEIGDMCNGINYPRMYCPKCGKPHFVPLDIWKKKKNKYN